MKDLEPFRGEVQIKKPEAGYVATGPGEALGHAVTDRITRQCDDRNRARRAPRGKCRRATDRDDDWDPTVDQLGRDLGQKLHPAVCVALLDEEVPSLTMAELGRALAEKRDERVGSYGQPSDP